MSAKDLSLPARYEVTKKDVQAYAGAPKKGENKILISGRGYRLER